MKATDEFRKWFDQFLAKWKDFVVERLAEGKGIESHMMVVKKDGLDLANGYAFIPCPFTSPTSKAIVFDLQKTLAREIELVDAVVVVTEAWMLSSDSIEGTKEERAAKMEELQKRGSIHDHPDRTECVIWSAMRGTQQLMATAPIDVDASLSELDMDSGRLKHLAGFKTLGAIVIVDPHDNAEGTPAMKGRMINSDTGNT